jgi:hypothetical protein
MTLANIASPTREGPATGPDRRRRAALFSVSSRAALLRAGAGIVLSAGALVAPWLGLTLRPSLSAWQIHLSLAAVPGAGHLSYAVLTAALALAATVSFVRSRGRPTWVTRCVGWSYLMLCVVFVVTTRLVEGLTMFSLQSDGTQTQIINSQYLTNSNLPPPTQFLGLSMDQKTLSLLYGLRLGWYILLAAGILLAGRLHRPSTTGQWTGVAGAALAVAAVLAGVTMGSVAQSEMDRGIQAVVTGQPVSGEHLLDAALDINPGMAFDSGLEQALGQAQANQGLQTGLADYAEAVRPTGRDLTVLMKAQLFGEAVAALPADSPAGIVVRNDVAVFLANTTLATKNPNLLAQVPSEASSPAVAFSVGHYYYEANANTLAIRMLRRAEVDTSNAEIKSLCLTYIALAWQRQGDEAAFRRDIVAAVKIDTLNQNVYAREIATGLYFPGTP